MQRIYRQMRSKAIDPADGNRLIWALGEIRKGKETVILEKRLKVLEGMMGVGSTLLLGDKDEMVLPLEAGA